MTKELKLNQWNVKKIEIANDYLKNYKEIDNKRVERCCIYMAELGENIGRELNKHRPVLVVSTDLFNRKNQPTLLVVPLTKDMIVCSDDPSRPRYFNHYFLKKDTYSFLDDDSTLQFEQMRVISKARLGRFVGKVNQDDMMKINNKLKKVLQLP